MKMTKFLIYSWEFLCTTYLSITENGNCGKILKYKESLVIFIFFIFCFKSKVNVIKINNNIIITCFCGLTMAINLNHTLVNWNKMYVLQNSNEI